MKFKCPPTCPFGRICEWKTICYNAGKVTFVLLTLIGVATIIFYKLVDLQIIQGYGK